MFAYNAVMLVLMIGATAAAAYLWPQFKVSLYPHYLICTVSKLYCILNVYVYRV